MSKCGYDVAFDVITPYGPNSLTLAMPSTAAKPSWDIFCNVIDNYGDIGVCWRLARQLATEHGFTVRLWIDKLNAFRSICPDIDPSSSIQPLLGVEVRRWEGDFAAVVPCDVVVETFACHPPEQFVEAMAARNPAPVWINLDYLSAEDWVSGCHALPSPHPRLPLTKYFFFPGFTGNTGGLLRENDLEERRRTFCASSVRKNEFWRTLTRSPPAAGALLVSLFAYENLALGDLLAIWAKGDEPVCCFAPMTRTLPAIEQFAGKSVQVGDVICRGNLEIRMLPFVAQSDYDQLLWLCDVNFVRGEDSFVRAQWAAKPMVWHIYPQDNEAHLAKLGAFLDLYCEDLPRATAMVVRQLCLAWNGGRIPPDSWRQWRDAQPQHRAHAVNWANRLSKQEDLCSSLVRFCRSKL